MRRSWNRGWWGVLLAPAHRQAAVLPFFGVAETADHAIGVAARRKLGRRGANDRHGDGDESQDYVP